MAMSVAEISQPGKLSALERESVEYFVSLVQIFGLPKSIGQIYGLLFVSPQPLPMDRITEELDISKGSASQGLTLLKTLGAVTPHQIPGDRREHYQADLNVSRIVSHFFENRLKDRLENGEARLESMLRLAQAAESAEPVEETNILVRIQALQKWQKRGRNIIPKIAKWLRR